MTCRRAQGQLNQLRIIYDGDCPFCSAYMRVTRLRDAVGTVEIIDARSGHPFVQEVKSAGVDLNEGMLADYLGEWYFGADCVHLLALLSSQSGLVNRVTTQIMRHRALARAFYPLLRFGRNAALRVLGRSRIT